MVADESDGEETLIESRNEVEEGEITYVEVLICTLEGLS